MKKFSVLLFIVLLAGCTFPGTNSNPGSSEIQATLEDASMDQPCNNLLFPLVMGQRWVYRIYSAGETHQMGLTVSGVQKNQATVDALDIGTGALTHSIAECDGTAILNFPLMTIKLIVGNYLNGAIELEHVSGVFVPANDLLNEEMDAVTWEGDFIAHGEVTAQDSEDNLTVTLSESPIKVSWETIGREAVTVPAGTYANALTVKRTMTLDVSVSADGMNLDGEIEIVTLHWFEPGVGLLKTRVDESNLIFLGTGYPLGLQGSAELMEFHPAE
jgi:hypothetical protein